MDFDSCTEDQQAAVRMDSEDRYLSYVLIIHNRNQNSKLKLSLQNDFTTGNNICPNSCPQTLHLLDKYINTAVPKMSAYEVLLFAQGYANKGNG